MGKNITLSVDETVLEKVRLVAAEQKTTVNAMVRAFLERKATESEIGKRRKDAAKRLLELSRNSTASMTKGWKFNREELYAERLSGHEHSDLRGGGTKE